MEWLCLVLSRTAVAVWLNMSKRKRFPDLDDYADWVVADAKEMDWVARHAHLRLYSHNATLFRNLQSRLSPDEWLHGCYTGGRVAHGCAIPLREYSSARSCNDTPKRQLTIHDFCKATAVAAFFQGHRSCGFFQGHRSCGGQPSQLRRLSGQPAVAVVDGKYCCGG